MLLALLVAPLALGAEPVVRNGFRLDPASIEVRQILQGGPPRDGIPALDHPPHGAGPDAWPDDALIIGVSQAGQSRAYPLALLVWHELVNDTLGGRPILVSYCPLCGTAMVFDRTSAAGGPPRRFGVSGLLYRSDLLMFDRATESLWSQISAEAVTGPSLGARLQLLRARTDTLGAWRRAHPETTVLSRETGHRRRYDTSPYGDYAESERLLFPVPRDPRYHPKMPTLGLRLPGGPARAYPAVEVIRAGGSLAGDFAGHAVRVRYDDATQTFRVEAPEPIEVVEGFWFAWAAFHPETEVAKAP